MSTSSTVPYLEGAVPVSERTAHPNGHGVAKEAVPNGSHTSPEVEENDVIHTDAIVIGAGFAGMTAIHKLRELGLGVKCFESGQDFGGVWYWNRYPGARVDSEMPYYQLNVPAVYQGWKFSERFPDHVQLRKYMAHVDSVLDLRRDTYFNARVTSCGWDAVSGSWTVRTGQGHVARAKYLLLCTGLLHQAYTPDFPGIGDYQGKIMHSGSWDTDFDPRGKKIGLIGAGATAVQITQELGKTAEELTVLLRRPSYCLPMRQREIPEDEIKSQLAFYPAYFRAGRQHFTGFPLAAQSKGVQDATPAERQQLWDRTWAAGGFHFSLSQFNDASIRPESNKIVYEFWRDKVRERLTDPHKAAIMAPDVAPYFFGTKRSPLEQDYYEVLNQPNVHIHPLNQAPLEKFTTQGMKMADGTEYSFDAVVLATGFDSFTGSMTRLGLADRDGISLSDRWKDGVSTYLGLMVSRFPNMFMAYSPQSPTALANGPTIIEVQIEMAVDMISKLEDAGAKSIDAEAGAEAAWKAELNAMSEQTLFPFTDSWWNGANIPGKKAETMNYIGGIPMYEKRCRATFEGGKWEGFTVEK